MSTGRENPEHSRCNRSKRTKIEAVVKALLEKETLEKEAFEALVGDPKAVAKDSKKPFVENEDSQA